MKKTDVLVSFVAVSVFALGLSARAESPKGTLNTAVSTTSGLPATSPRKSSANSPEIQTEATCGIACRYHQANDNLTLQALYLVTKVQKVSAAIEKGDDSSSANARVALGAFCKNEDEALSDCFSRYKFFQRIALLDIRQSIGKNEDMIARLTTSRKNDGSVDGTALVYETGGEKVPYFPEVPTLAELEASYLKGNLKPAGSKYSRAEIQKWSQELVVNNPKTRYFEFNAKPVVGNPYQEEKTSYTLYMQKRNDQGEASGEDAKAVKLYRESENSVKAFALDEKKEIGDQKIKVITPTKKLKNEDVVSYEAFTQARSVVNGKIDSDIKRRDQEEVDRKLASKPKPSPTPSGSPAPAAVGTGTSRDVRVTTGTSAIRTPSSYKTYGDDEKVERPPEMKNSRYIKYDLTDMLNDIDTSTK